MVDTRKMIERSTKLAAQALERIKQENIPPVPENYELWYVYYSKAHPEITRAIDILEANKQKITDERCRELHERYLSENQDREEIREAGDRIKETINDVRGVVTGVKSATNTYNTNLSEATGKLNADLDKQELEKVLKGVLGDTRNMMSHNMKLESELNRSSQVMEELQRNLEKAQKEALTDALTGLANRKAFDTEIENIAQKCEEEGTTFSLIMMDIDHFKAFNDNFGHQVGDQVLRLVAKTLTDGVKGRDMAARYGGEEFAIILPETNLEAAIKVGDYLRKAVANKDIVNRNTGEKMGRITLSGGAAQYTRNEKIEDIIERADAALYTAKHNGRNQIASAPIPGQKKASR